jgi:2-polyprenyl-3-methyl-5-hydroxy-6-metoxy-1,4-benzoquinol methylase
MSLGDVRDYYNHFGGDYDRLRNLRRYYQWVGHRELEFVLRYVPKGSTVLEIGPGSGFFTQHLVKKAREVVAMDIAPAVLATLKERIPADNLSLFQRGVEDLAGLAGHGQFDCVVCMRVLLHVFDVEGALQNIHSALHPGGNALLDHWNQRSLILLARRLVGSKDNVFARYFVNGQMTELIENVGSAVDHAWGWGYPGFDWIGYRIAKKFAHAVIFNLVKCAPAVSHDA